MRYPPQPSLVSFQPLKRPSVLAHVEAVVHTGVNPAVLGVTEVQSALISACPSTQTHETPFLPDTNYSPARLSSLCWPQKQEAKWT